jgi:cytochrome c
MNRGRRVMRWLRRVAILMLLGVVMRPVHAEGPVGDANRGRALYQSCLGCHSIDEDDVGPRHRGVVGRRAGSVPSYAYSAALRSSGLVWMPSVLDRWLQNPQALVPGSKMFFSLADPRDRADIIAYLATLGGP